METMEIPGSPTHLRAYVTGPTTTVPDPTRCAAKGNGRVVGVYDAAVSDAYRRGGGAQWAPVPVRDLTSSSAYLAVSGSSLDRTVPSQPIRKPNGIEMMPGFFSGK